ncbi:transposase [Verticillium dahliae]
MHQNVLIKSENRIVREEMEVLSRRRRAKKTRLRKGGSMALGEGQDIQAQNKVEVQVKQETHRVVVASRGRKRSNGAVGLAESHDTTRELVR